MQNRTSILPILFLFTILSSPPVFSDENIDKKESSKQEILFDDVMELMTEDKNEIALVKLEALLKYNPQSHPLRLLKSKLLIRTNDYLGAKRVLESLPKEVRALDDYKFAWLRVHYGMLGKSQDPETLGEYQSSFKALLEESHLFLPMRAQYVEMLQKHLTPELKERYCAIEAKVSKDPQKTEFCVSASSKGGQ